MHCPRCLEEVTGDICPGCGKPVSLAEPRQASGGSAQGAIRFSTSTQYQTPPDPAPDWREEIRKKLDRHQLRKEGGRGDVEARVRAREAKDRARRQIKQKVEASPPKTDAGTSSPEVSRELFKYRLNEEREKGQPRIVTFQQKSPERPTSRSRPEKPTKKSEPVDPRQKPLELVQKNAELDPTPESGLQVEPSEVLKAPLPPPYPSARPQVEFSREVLFSRLLSGLLDLIIALAAGALFGFLASRLLSAELTSPAMLEVAAGCALALWLLNMIFFLSLGRQTPGMMITELELVAEPPQGLGLGRIIGRVLLQVLSTLSVVGLVWAIFDRQNRCWHDRLSRTLIEPIVEDFEEMDAMRLKRPRTRRGGPHR